MQYFILLIYLKHVYTGICGFFKLLNILINDYNKEKKRIGKNENKRSSIQYLLQCVFNPALL